METVEKQRNKKNEDEKIFQIDGLEHQSRITKLVRPNNYITKYIVFHVEEIPIQPLAKSLVSLLIENCIIRNILLVFFV